MVLRFAFLHFVLNGLVSRLAAQRVATAALRMHGVCLKRREPKSPCFYHPRFYRLIATDAVGADVINRVGSANVSNRHICTAVPEWF